ncbi:hypothetical protein A3D77_07305 [Candidatus Gottesmanbacteria bacterium RIFCSPHIGHO2_02_FULL_39_11]|uniref:DUF2304 domain-containing protein n=1 Tax=Candidatus Gottesmanbacteria bacterium RIFCSPHIGHO2_02_FULL_39_11 TaxID=1798382 RepID=A0A1F5ZK08_9BACT|nr:MAG: hypothetical protein A3D77_07305 [Candidatus Gottesmanbacteria bacterium RIFCSPHIGHO2_02_FULL_39_11]
MVTPTQAVLSLFLLFALSRVFLRFRSGSLRKVGFFFWVVVFGFAILIVIFPGLSTGVAKFLGIGRGVDAVVYTSIALLFYLVFRVHIMVEDLRHEITELVSKLALDEFKKKNEKKSSKN